MAIALGANTLEDSRGMQQMSGSAARLASTHACVASPGIPCEIAAFVARLPCQQRAALILRRHHQRDYAAIATTLGCTEQEARGAVYAALRALRAHLGDRI